MASKNKAPAAKKPAKKAPAKKQTVAGGRGRNNPKAKPKSKTA